jgi:phosphoserine phosphatase RsbU/P
VEHYINRPLRLLIVEDSEDDTILLVSYLADSGYDPEFERVETAEAMRAALNDRSWDAIISDYVMPHFSGMEALAILRESGLVIPFILVFGKIDEATAAKAIQAGADDYFTKGDFKRLIPALEQQLRLAATRRNISDMERVLSGAWERQEHILSNNPAVIYSLEIGGDSWIMTFVTENIQRHTGYDQRGFLEDSSF